MADWFTTHGAKTGRPVAPSTPDVPREGEMTVAAPAAAPIPQPRDDWWASQAGATEAEAEPSGPRPNSPQDRLERLSTSVFGDYAPMVKRAVGPLANMATAVPGLSGLAGTAQLIEGGAPAGAMLGGTAVGLGTRNYAGGVAGAAGGGAAGGMLQRWFRGEPQQASDATWDAIGQGALQAVTPGVGKVLEKVAAPIYRMALGAPKALVAEFGDVGEQALKEGYIVSKGGAESAEAALNAAGAAKGAGIAEAMTRGARKSTPADVATGPFREILRDARLLKQGGGDPPVGEIVRQYRGLKAGMGRHGGVELDELDAMKQLVQKENSAALAAAASDKPVHPLQKQAGMARASVLREMAEDRANEVGVNLKPLNARYQELIPIEAALKNAELRRLSGGQRGWQGIADRFARTLAVPQISSATAIGLDRTGKALGGDRLTNAVRLLQMQIAGDKGGETPADDPTMRRSDGSRKGQGFLGSQRRPDGSTSSEISVGVNIDGKEMEIPTLVPTLSASERQWLLTNDLSDPGAIPKPIIDKAIAHARKRISAGQPVFAP